VIPSISKGNDESHVKTATTEEIKVSLEVGFEYVYGKDRLVFLQKRKKGHGKDYRAITIKSSN